MSSKRLRGIVFIIMSAFCFASMALFVRLAGDLPSIQKSFFRNFVSLLVGFVTMKRAGTHFTGKKENLKFLFLRATFGTIGILGNFYAVDHMVLADAGMLNKMSPFFAIICSIFILGEHVKPVQMMMVITAFLGSLLIIKPTGTGMELVPALVGFLGGAGAGTAYSCVRKLTKLGEKSPCIVVFFSAFSCMVCVPSLLFDFHPMTIQQLLLLMGAGVAAAGGQFSITAAYSCAPAREISVYDYSQIIFSAVFGFFFFGQIPDIYSWIGYLIIISMAVLMFLYNQRQDAKAIQ